MAMTDVLALLGRAIVEDTGPEALRELIDTAPGLSDAEREDLRKIPYRGLEPYQSDYYRFERDMLEWGFEHTWACLRQMDFGLATANGRPRWRDFMVNFRSSRPSRTHSVRETGRHFLAFLREDCAKLCAANPWLPELAEMERLEIEVLYAMDNPLGQPITEAELDELFAQPLDMLFERRIVRAEKVTAQTFHYDLPAIKQSIVNVTDGRAVDFSATEFQLLDAPFQLAVSRDHDTLIPAWFRVTPEEHDLLNATPEASPTTVEVWVEQYCLALEARSTGPSDDEQLLARALTTLHSNLARRFLLIV